MTATYKIKEQKRVSLLPAQKLPVQKWRNARTHAHAHTRKKRQCEAKKVKGEKKKKQSRIFIKKESRIPGMSMHHTNALYINFNKKERDVSRLGQKGE